MPRVEVCWRARAAARTASERIGVHLRPRRWNREDLEELLAEDAVDHALRSAIAARQWDVVHDGLAERIRARTSRFALDPASAVDLRDSVLSRWPAADAHAADHADTILAGRYDLLGYPALICASPGGEVDWHHDPVHNRRAPRRFWADVPYLDPAIGDHKIIWELNRHQHWLRLGRALWLTGDLRYARRIIDELDGWLATNPPLVGINWASMLELGLRAISWTWGLHFLLGTADPRPPHAERSRWLVDMLVALDQQLTHVERHLSVYFSPNTHLTGEALALYVVGVALPELAASRRWVETGRRVLLEQLDRQVRADGGHVERSTHYQRYTLDFSLMALVTAQQVGDADAVRRFGRAVGLLADFTRTMADDTGRLPLIGDDDGGMLWPIAGRACVDVRDSLALAGVLLGRPDLAPWGVQEEVFWMAGPTAVNRTRQGAVPDAVSPSLMSRALPESGYVVARDAAGAHAVFSVGQQASLNGGHAHADALAITLVLAGRPLLVDPGTSTYTMDRRLRNQLRSSVCHNTITLDGRSQSLPGGPFGWQSRAEATLDDWVHSPDFDCAEGSHDGYAPVRHRRTVLRTAESGWLVVDDVLGEGRHDASAHWHFHPDWSLRRDSPGRLHARHVQGDQAWLLHDAGEASLMRGDDASGLGWYAPAYGTLVPTWSARVMHQGTAPFTMVTWIGGPTVPAQACPTLERVVPRGDVIGVRVVAGPRSSVFLLQRGEPRPHAAHTCGALDYQTDARTLHYLEIGGRLERLDLVDASHARARRDGWLSVEASDTMPSLHVTVKDGVLDVQTPQPPARLRVQGRAMRGARSVRLNHRDYPAPGADAMVVVGADWAEPEPSPSSAR